VRQKCGQRMGQRLPYPCQPGWFSENRSARPRAADRQNAGDAFEEAFFIGIISAPVGHVLDAESPESVCRWARADSLGMVLRATGYLSLEARGPTLVPRYASHSGSLH
jgi:hypothetical protein